VNQMCTTQDVLLHSDGCITAIYTLTDSLILSSHSTGCRHGSNYSSHASNRLTATPAISSSTTPYRMNYLVPGTWKITLSDEISRPWWSMC